MQFQSPMALLLLGILPVLAYLMLRGKRTAAVKFPNLGDMKNCPVSWRIRLRPLLVIARLACLALLIFALARPRKGTRISEISTEGVAIEVVVDHSGSMANEMNYDGRNLSRLQVVKKVLADFVAGDDGQLQGRAHDLIGLVAFAKYADTKCPLVHSHDALLEFLNKTEIVKLENENSTSIGDAIALAAARLKKAEQEIQQRRKRLGFAGEDDPGDFEIKSKVIILLTDGINNSGEYDPIEAAELAAGWGIKIYTIGIGSDEQFSTVQTFAGTMRVPLRDNLDEALLNDIASKTGGFYGRAGDAKTLRQIVTKIDEMEKTKVRSMQYTQFAERFAPWALAALILLTLEILGSCTVFRKIP